jgi:transcriptional regulator with XRE-family HTH domain/quercetin dioxygenase-like cupin family protein
MTTSPNEVPSAEEPEEAAHPTAGIGERLARLRGERGVKVSALAREAGVSPSLISQIERGLSRPSVSTLFALSEALDVPVDAFFRDGAEHPAAAPAAPVPPPPARTSTGPPERPVAVAGGPRHRYVVRSDERDVLEIEGGVRWESLTPRPLDELEFLELVYAPGAESSPRSYRHPGTEMVVVLSGRLVIHVGFERHELEPGDSIHFPSSMPHRYVNPGDDTARAVSVIVRDDTPPPP